MREVDERPDLPTQFSQFARWLDRDGGHLYRDICLRLAHEPAVYGLLDRARPAQRRPQLLLNAVHYLLLGGADHPLARRYPTVVHARALDPAPPGDEADVGQLFVDFCAWQPSELGGVISERAVQTNEVGRCAALLPAFATLRTATAAPLSMLDLGASAGLNLLFDRYSYTYTHGEERYRAGDPESTVHIGCTLRNGVVPPLDLPALTGRRGVDLAPGDPADPDQARWLLSCLWPHDLERFTRLEAALALVAALPPAERPVVTAGDLIESLPALVDAVPRDHEPVVVHTWVAAYLNPAEQRALRDAVFAIAGRRRVWWLFAETPFETPELPFAPAPGDQPHPGTTALTLVRLEGTDLEAHRLADMHDHGRWLRWWGGP